jgi:photosystem II stability/assembly factor-like uncharacterized protein
MYRTTRRLAVVALLVALCTIPTVFSYAQGPGLMETFDDATLPGWDHSDDVAVVDGALRVPAPGFAFYHADWRDMVLTVQARFEGTGELLLVYRMSDAGSYQLLIGHDYVFLERDVAGVRTKLGAGPMRAVADREWLHVSVVVNQDGHTISVNDEQLLSVSDDPATLPPGGVGLQALGEAVGEFDDLMVTSGGARLPPADIVPPDVAPTAPSGSPAYEAATWVRLGGPPGGLGYDIRMRPDNPDIMFVTASPGGIFKSIDGGQTWFAVNEGLEPFPGAGANIFCATIDPHNPDTVWIGTQFSGHVYRSTDGGTTWQRRDNGITEMVGEHSVRGITVDPVDPNTVYVALERGIGMGGVSGEVYKSTDAGANWTSIWQGENLARYIWIDPRNTQRLYVSTGIFDRDAANADPEHDVCGGVGILRSDDGGQTWTVLDRSNGLGGLYIPSLSMHPTNPDILLAAITTQSYCPEDAPGVYVSRDGGDAWELILPMGTMEAVEISDTDPNIWYAAARGVFFRSDDSGQSWHEYLLRTTDRGAGIPIDLQADPRDPLRIFDNNYGGGNLLSTNGGESWVDASSGYTGATIRGVAVLPGDGSTLLVGAETGTFRSTDSGLHWSGVGIEGYASEIVLYTGMDGTPRLIASGSDNDGHVYHSTNGGLTWQPSVVADTPYLELGGALFQPRALVVAPSDSQIMYLGYSERACIIGAWPECTHRAPGLFRSHDGGVSWAHVEQTPFEGSSILAATVAPDNARTLYVTTLMGLFVSLDGGDTWLQVTSLEDVAGWNQITPEIAVPPATTVAADPFNPQIIYVGTFQRGVWMSQDGGTSWVQASAGMDPNETIAHILPDPDRPGVIYASSRQTGVYVSTDGAQTWRPLNQGLDFRTMEHLALSADGSVLYVGSRGAGVFRLGTPAAASP